MLVMREMPDVALDAKARLQRSSDQPIVQADLEDLVQKLSQMQRKINNRAEWEITDSKDGENTEWNQASHAAFVVPTLQTANSPKAIVDFALARVDSGARSAELVYKLMIAEMDAAVARWYVTMNAGLGTQGLMSEALLATTNSPAYPRNIDSK
jgi:hypothetical protein